MRLGFGAMGRSLSVECEKCRGDDACSMSK